MNVKMHSDTDTINIAEYLPTSDPNTDDRAHASAWRSTAGSNAYGFTHTAARLLVCLTLTLAMMMTVILPESAYAASDTSQDQVSQESSDGQAQASQEDIDDQEEETEAVIRTARTLNISGLTLRFRRAVIVDERLAMAPANLVATGARRSIRLDWEAVDSPEGILGYIVLRKDPNNDVWRRIAAVDNMTTTYTDEESADKDILYSYTVVAYKHVDGKTMVSEPTEWAGAITTRSSAKNVTECKITNLANVVSIMTGSSARPELKFSDKAYSTEMRWSSSNSSIASVDEAGLVTGVSTGTATIYARSHTGSLTSFDVHITKPGSAQAMIDTFSAWMGYSRINGKQNGIIDIYNSITPWPQGYKMRYSDAWCDATITAAAIKTGNVERIGRECSVPRHIKIFQQLGIWEEDGTITPRPGDIIVYSWSRFRQPNNASASHIGLVVKVEGNQITCIEGNRGIGIVDTRTIPVGWGCIRGYARPNYNN